MDDIPHLALPLRVVGDAFDVVQQDTLDEVITNVRVVASFEIGYREDKPEFGIPEQAPADLPLNLQDLEETIESWEPRAAVRATEAPYNPADPLTDRVRLAVAMSRSNED